jgi:hypothetical protein
MHSLAVFPQKGVHTRQIQYVLDHISQVLERASFPSFHHEDPAEKYIYVSSRKDDPVELALFFGHGSRDQAGELEHCELQGGAVYDRLGSATVLLCPLTERGCAFSKTAEKTMRMSAFRRCVAYFPLLQLPRPHALSRLLGLPDPLPESFVVALSEIVIQLEMGRSLQHAVTETKGKWEEAGKNPATPGGLALMAAANWESLHFLE